MRGKRKKMVHTCNRECLKVIAHKRGMGKMMCVQKGAGRAREDIKKEGGKEIKRKPNSTLGKTWLKNGVCM